MDGWASYTQRMDAVGDNKRQMWVNRTSESIRRRAMTSPSTHLVTINGIEQYVSITHRAKISEKRICALPGEHLRHGGLVKFNSSTWLITEVDADNEVYERGLMRRCNHQLRWIGRDGIVRTKWCVVEDGTKYLIGEATSRYDNLMVIGDARIAVTIGKDDDTLELNRGLRFLIDDTDVSSPSAYQITKANRFFNTYEGEGVFRFILNEVVLTANDNISERIADYNNWMPVRELDGDHRDSDCTVAEIVEAAETKVNDNPPSDNKETWL
jgi:hypothetical protein